MHGSWRRWSCQVSIVIAALVGSSGSFPASAQTTTRAVAKQALPYYAYGFYVRADTKRDLVGEAEAIARPLLVQHRLIPASEMKSWNGSGQLPISFDREIVPDRVAANMRTRDDDLAFPALALPDLVKLLPKSVQIQRPVTMVLMRIGVRQQRNLTAYAEALRVGRAVAQKLEASIAFDHETGARIAIRDFDDWRFHGQVNRVKNYAAPDQSSSVDEIGPDNPPAVEIIGPVVQNQDRQGVVTRGMRKFGLPDIHLGQVMTGMSPFWLVSAVANTLAGGRMPDPETSRFEIRAGELAAKVETLGRDMAQPMIAVRLTPARELSSPTGNTILAIGFYGTPSQSLFERQVLVGDAFFGTRYQGLPAEDATRLSLAVARARAKLIALEQGKARLKASGSKVFVAFRADLDVQSVHEGASFASWSQTWDEVIAWPSDKGGRLTRRWRGDPRNGGQVFKYDPPMKVGDMTFHFRESNAVDGADDVLVLDRAGKAEGGEVSGLLPTLFPKISLKQKTP